MVFQWHPSIFFLLSLFFFIVFLLKWFFNTPKTQENLPPSPPKLPIVGNLHQIGLLPHRSLRALAQRYGPLMLLHLGGVPVLIVSSADAAHEIMKTHDLIFSNRPKSSIAKRVLYDSKDIAFAPYGEYWRQVKSISVLQLLSNRRVQSFKNVREEETALMIQKIRQNCSSSSSVVNLSEILLSLTNDVVCRVVLGRKYSGGGEVMELLGGFVQLLGVFNVGDYIPWLAWVNRVNGLDSKVEKLAKGLDEFLEGIVKDHMESKKGKNGGGGGGGDSVEQGTDFVDSLLEIQREKMTGFSIHRDTIKAIIMDMFGAGTDTTYTVIEWAMTELLRQQETMKKLQNEVREVARGKSNITEDDLEKVHYLKAVIKETLRLHPPIPLLVPRESTQDVKVMGYEIAASTRVIINAWAIGRDPLSWEEPEEFQPERFLNASIDYKGQHFELIPFGAGRRGCPGIHFAVSVFELALAKLMLNFDFALPGAAPGEDMDMTEVNGIAVHKKSPLLVAATPSSCH